MTRFLPDTSCLVAALCSWHEHHGATCADLRAAALADEKVASALDGREPKKVIVVRGKLVNVVG